MLSALPTSWTGIAGIGAVVAIVTAGWSYVQMALKWLQDLVICHAFLTDEVSEAVMAYCWHKGKRSPFGTRVFSGANSWVQPASRIQLVAFENVSSDPVLFWVGKAPIIIRRRGGKDDTNTGSSNNTRSFDMALIVFSLRGTIDLDQFILDAVTHYNHVKQGLNGESKRKRFFVRRIGNNNKQENGAPSQEYAQKTGQVISEELVERVAQKTLRLLQWKPEDLVHRSPDQTPFHGYIFPPEILSAMNEMRLWLDNEKWFRTKNIPWRHGWLLHGPPGTGKSTLTRAMAMQFDLPVFSIDLSTMDNEAFVRAWEDVASSAPCVALLEDIDAVFKGRENVSVTNRNRDSLTFDCLLNCISGVGNSEGVFLVVTTNHPETLDPALGVVKDGRSSRPGRIDRVIELTFMQRPEREVLARHILSDFPEQIEHAVNAGEGMTPAQFQDLCAQEALQRFWTKTQETKS
jgi:hypothetical protein